MHCVDLDASFQTHNYLQNLASIQPGTSPLKFAGAAFRVQKTLLSEVLIEAPELQICEQNILDLLEAYREIMRRLDTHLAGPRFFLLDDIS